MASIVSLFDNTHIDPVTACFSEKDRAFINDLYLSYQETFKQLEKSRTDLERLEKENPNPFHHWREIGSGRVARENYDATNDSPTQLGSYTFSFIYAIEKLDALKHDLQDALLCRIIDYVQRAYHKSIYINSNEFKEKLGLSFSIQRLYTLLIEELELNGSTLTEIGLQQSLVVFNRIKDDEVSIKGSRLTIQDVAYENWRHKLISLFSYYMTGDLTSNAGDFLQVGQGYKTFPDDQSKIVEVRTFANRKMEILFSSSDHLHEFVAMFKLPIFQEQAA